VQRGSAPSDRTPIKRAGQGVKEIGIKGSHNIYRVIYIAKFEEAVYVLYAFKKTTTKSDIGLEKMRYKALLNPRYAGEHVGPSRCGG
jgi:phage-related protein